MLIRSRRAVAGCLLVLGACSASPDPAALRASEASSGGGNSAAPSQSAGAGGAGGDGGAGGCVDACPKEGASIRHECKSRFLYGVNFAWRHFGADFGGLTQWKQLGVSADAPAYAESLAAMRAHGASVVRWWVFPDFRGDGVAFGPDETPIGLAGTAKADLEKALELAEKEDVYLMLCLFSFDGFRPSRGLYDVPIPSLSGVVLSTEKRAALLEKVVRPLAQAAEASPHRSRLLAWDVINEPEWAMKGESPYGDDDYGDEPDLVTVTHDQMERFVADTIDVLRAESGAQITVGGAALKWARAWSAVDIDFYQFHLYDWVNTYWPYTTSPSIYGVTDKPVIVGEFPLAGLTGVPYSTLLEGLFSGDYAGALGWQHDEATAKELADVAAFAEGEPCETRY